MLVVAVSALLALLFTMATRPSDDVVSRAAGEAKVQLVLDEHALVADLIRNIQDKDEAERLAAEHSRANMRALAAAETVKEDTDTPVRTALSGKSPIRAARPVPKPAPAVEPPLQLQVATASPPKPGKPVVARAQAALATVQQIPQWLRTGAENVADWAMSAPAKAISHLPERRFL